MTALLAVPLTAFRRLKRWLSSSACTAQSVSIDVCLHEGEQDYPLLLHPSSESKKRNFDQYITTGFQGASGPQKFSFYALLGCRITAPCLVCAWDVPQRHSSLLCGGPGPVAALRGALQQACANPGDRQPAGPPALPLLPFLHSSLLSPSP